MERVATVLTEARAVGLEVRAEADRLIVRGPRAQEALAKQLLAQKLVVLELLATEDTELAWRIAAMQPQVPRSGPIPFLVARDRPHRAGQCLSCGERLNAGRTVRCGLCVRAAQIVLGWVREDIGGSE